jgi:prolyl 4-hydroxylase
MELRKKQKTSIFEPNTTLTINKRYKRYIVSEIAPSMWTIDNFLSETELEKLIQISQSNGWKQSTTDSKSDDGDEVRTSQTKLLPDIKIIRNIQYRILNLLNLEHKIIENKVVFEQPQMIRYSDGQENNLHHDSGILYDDGTIESQYPLRHWTVLIYLNDLDIENGGATVFPELNINVDPIASKALIFPNINSSGPMPNMVHYAEKFTENENNTFKFAINFWLCVLN